MPRAGAGEEGQVCLAPTPVRACPGGLEGWSGGSQEGTHPREESLVQELGPQFLCHWSRRLTGSAEHRAARHPSWEAVSTPGGGGRSAGTSLCFGGSLGCPHGGSGLSGES